jgi:hypothetical protein
MAVGFPAKTTYANGDVFSASDINDTNGTLNLLNPSAKGSLISASAANTPSILSVGTDGQTLIADSSTATGLKWATPIAGKVLQVVQNTYSTTTTIATTSMTDTGLTATITPSSASSKVLVLVAQQVSGSRSAASIGIAMQLLRGASVIRNLSGVGGYETFQAAFSGATTAGIAGIVNVSYLDSPATTSATTYKTQGRVQNSTNSGSAFFQENSIDSTIILLEIGA